MKGGSYPAKCDAAGETCCSLWEITLIWGEGKKKNWKNTFPTVCPEILARGVPLDLWDHPLSTGGSTYWAVHSPKAPNGKHIPPFTATMPPSTIFKRFYWLIFRRSVEKGGEIHVRLPLLHPQLGIWPATQACALTGNWTSDHLVHRPVHNPLSYTRPEPGPLFVLFSHSQTLTVSHLWWEKTKTWAIGLLSGK